MGQFSFYEFFAGGGMARAGLGSNWQCSFANDISPKKAASYEANWTDRHLRVADVTDLTIVDLPGIADLAWASFPCQDLSLAGDGTGLKGKRSGTFWPFWKLIQALTRDGRPPRLIVLENVCGALTSHGGKDFAAIGTTMANAGFRFGALVVDAVHFVPQSRPRLFIIGVHDRIRDLDAFTSAGPETIWRPPSLVKAVDLLPSKTAQKWLWWRLPPPQKRKHHFADIIEEDPENVSWHTRPETARLLSLMSDVNLNKVETAQRMGRRVVGGVYKRTRNGTQRAEVRFDNVSGCLRTPVGGSSRQTILIVNGDDIRSRLLSPREAARLMGLPDSYVLPERYNDAYHLAGDGLVVPVVRHIAQHILEPVLEADGAATLAA